MGEWSWKSQKENDGAKQLPERKESLIVKIHSLVVKSKQSISIAKSLN
jgi:hypothetical protein